MYLAHSKRKSKGTNAERELVNILWDNGWASVRIAGSGSVKHPSPDIIAGKKGLVYVIECKTTYKLPKYLKIEEVEELELFASRLGAIPIVAVKVYKNGWFLMDSRGLRRTERGVVFEKGEVLDRWLKRKE